MGSNGRIVVGVDGSPQSIRALRWAVDEARQRGAAVEAILVHNYPPAGIGIGFGPEIVLPQIEQIESEAHDNLRSAVNEVVPRDKRDVEVITRVEKGPPADVLVRASREATLLVVGARGLGGFRGLLLGSVSQQCVTHASCPVAVIPSEH